MKKRTARDRFSRALSNIRSWCRHDDVKEQHRALARTLNGPYAYYGVTSNYDALARLWNETVLTWRKWLSRRSQKAYLNWIKMTRLLEHYPLPPPRTGTSRSEVERAVRERDGNQCTFTDAQSRRCSERRFLTLEHRIPFALGGPPTVENLCCLCTSHNAFTARQVFGEAFIAEKRAQRAARAETRAEEAPAKPDLFAKLRFALCKMGFRERDVRKAVAHLAREPGELEAEPLLRAALGLLTPSMTSR